MVAPSVLRLKRLLFIGFRETYKRVTVANGDREGACMGSRLKPLKGGQHVAKGKF